jgi:ParB family chromosome partitioning protein
MAKTTPKVILSRSRDIPFEKLVLSQSNVRHVQGGISIEQLAESIAQRTLLQSLSVRAILDADGKETGMFEVPAGGRRFRALELLVKQKRMSRTQPVPCVVRADGIAEDDSLAENLERAELHPLDQFRAFQALKDKGLDDEEIAARQFVSVNVVKQRLRLAAVSPKLLDHYAEGDLTLEQLMAFTIVHDHSRQEQVWAGLANGWNKQPYHIRRLLTEGAVNASDRRAVYIGIDAYLAAGGVVSRDLFEPDQGGWLEDPALLERLVRQKLEGEADATRMEGWRWVETAIDFPYGHTAGLRQLHGEIVELSEDESRASEALREEYDRLQIEHGGADELPEEVDVRLAEIETALEAFADRPLRYVPAEVARAGVFVSLDANGHPRIQRGYVRAEDEPAAAPDVPGGEDTSERASTTSLVNGVDGTSENEQADEDGDGVLRPLSDRLKLELSAHRTLALRDAVAGDPEVAFRVALHAVVLATFYPSRLSETCLELSLRSTAFATQAPGLSDCASAVSIEQRRDAWRARLPEKADALWDALGTFDDAERGALFAHCIALGINAQHETWSQSSGRARSADQIAGAVELNMAAAGWAPTVDTYLGRVPKARILEAVRQVKGEREAKSIEHLKKPEMALQAELLLSGSGWLPEPLRTVPLSESAGGAEAEPSVAVAAE